MVGISFDIDTECIIYIAPIIRKYRLVNYEN